MSDLHNRNDVIDFDFVWRFFATRAVPDFSNARRKADFLSGHGLDLWRSFLFRSFHCRPVCGNIPQPCSGFSKWRGLFCIPKGLVNCRETGIIRKKSVLGTMKMLYAWFVAFGVCFLAPELFAQYTLTYSTNGSFITLTGYTGTPVNVTIPSFVNSIGIEAFAYSTGLTSITVGRAVTNIEELAFYDCPNLTSLFFEGNAPVIGPLVFYSPGSPDEVDPAFSYYLPGKIGWNDFSQDNNMPSVLWNPILQSAGFQNNEFIFKVTGTPNIPIQIAATTNLSAEMWTVLQTCTLTNGSIQFSDPGSSNNPSRFYTVQFP